MKGFCKLTLRQAGPVRQGKRGDTLRDVPTHTHTHAQTHPQREREVGYAVNEATPPSGGAGKVSGTRACVWWWMVVGSMS